MYIQDTAINNRRIYPTMFGMKKNISRLLFPTKQFVTGISELIPENRKQI